MSVRARYHGIFEPTVTTCALQHALELHVCNDSAPGIITASAVFAMYMASCAFLLDVTGFVAAYICQIVIKPFSVVIKMYPHVSESVCLMFFQTSCTIVSVISNV